LTFKQQRGDMHVRSWTTKIFPKKRFKAAAKCDVCQYEKLTLFVDGRRACPICKRTTEWLEMERIGDSWVPKKLLLINNSQVRN